MPRRLGLGLTTVYTTDRCLLLASAELTVTHLCPPCRGSGLCFCFTVLSADIRRALSVLAACVRTSEHGGRGARSIMCLAVRALKVETAFTRIQSARRLRPLRRYTDGRHPTEILQGHHERVGDRLATNWSVARRPSRKTELEKKAAGRRRMGLQPLRLKILCRARRRERTSSTRWRTPSSRTSP